MVISKLELNPGSDSQCDGVRAGGGGGGGGVGGGGWWWW